VLVIGVAGGIASGKTTVAKLYESFGSTVLDADAIGHEILETEDMRNTLVQAFGNQITGAAGVVDRRALGRVVFGDRLARKKLNQLIRPPIRATIRQRIQRMREESKTDVVVVDAPLLVDTGPTDLADCVILVTARVHAKGADHLARWAFSP